MEQSYNGQNSEIITEQREQRKPGNSRAAWAWNYWIVLMTQNDKVFKSKAEKDQQSVGRNLKSTHSLLLTV